MDRLEAGNCNQHYDCGSDCRRRCCDHHRRSCLPDSGFFDITLI